MSNKVYLTLSANETLQSLDLTANQRQDLDAAISLLGGDAAWKSRVVFEDGTEATGLRELRQKDIRIFFRYDPRQAIVMVADVRIKNSSRNTQTQSENALAGAA